MSSRIGSYALSDVRSRYLTGPAFLAVMVAMNETLAGQGPRCSAGWILVVIVKLGWGGGALLSRVGACGSTSRCAANADAVPDAHAKAASARNRIMLIFRTASRRDFPA